MKTTDPILDSWHSVAGRHASETAVVELATGHSWTFSELRRAGIDQAGRIGSGPVVSPRGQGVEFIVAVLGAWESGRVICPLDTDMESRPEARWDDLRERHPAAAMAKTTSGSTGVPRHVLFSAAALVADADQIVRTMGLNRDLPNIAAISLAHSYGFANLVMPLLRHGQPLRLASSPLPEAVRAALSWGHDDRPVVLPGVPAMWRAWQGAGLVTSRVAIAISAGAPLPLELERQVFDGSGVKIHNFLGSSECGGIAYDRTAVPRTAATLVGTAMEDVRLSVDADGMLIVHSAAVGMAYWSTGDDAAGSPLTSGDGEFRTGDLAEERADGWHLVGRVADTINVAGRKVHPSEIEHRLRGHPAVAECLVFGVPSPDPARGDEIVAVIAGAETIDGASIQEWLAATGPSWQVPRHWWWCPELAANTRGKLSRNAWREDFLSTIRPR